MELRGGIGSKEIKVVIEEHPRIGEILNNHMIDCIKCTVGTCLLETVVAVHSLGEDIEKQIEQEINNYLASTE